jgi:transposase-like protein
MANPALTKPQFQDEASARKWLESIRWPNGPVCPHCGSESKDHYALKGKAHRPGLHKCKDCREQFSVTVGTVFERSKVPLHLWVQAMHLMCSSKKGISSKQLERTLGVTYQTAWFMTHRIREAMKPNGGGMLGGPGKVVEIDETYVGGKEHNKHASKRTSATGGKGKQIVFALVERGGHVRSHHVPSVRSSNLRPILQAQVHAETRVMSDEGGARLSAEFENHAMINHSAGEYVRGDVTTNNIEGYFSILKRGIIGTFHHVSPQHLQRYATEFDFRYNHRETKIKVNGKMVKAGFTDAERTVAALKGIGGKRLTYRRINATA